MPPPCLPALGGSVGLNGLNRFDDVTLVQRLLNCIPPTLGGPATKLDPDGFTGTLTNGAIAGFQQARFGWSDGKVDVGGKTYTEFATMLGLMGWASQWMADLIAMLVKASPGAPPPSWKTSPWELSYLRYLILLTGLTEAAPRPAGAVSDSDLVTEHAHGPTRPAVTVRRGWRRLQEYFDAAVPGTINMASPLHRNGIQLRGYRVVNNAEQAKDMKKYGVHWCGIFATWVYRQALRYMPVPPAATVADVRWEYGSGLTIPKRRTYTSSPGLPKVGKREIRPGDVCVIENGYSHHFIALDFPDLERNRVLSVNGNSTAEDGDFHTQSVLVKWQSLSAFSALYSADGAVSYS